MLQGRDQIIEKNSQYPTDQSKKVTRPIGQKEPGVTRAITYKTK